MKPAHTFWDKIAPKYSKKNVPNIEIYNEKLTLIRAISDEKFKCLEIGCGTGSTALALAKSFDEIVATDFSMEMIKIANQKKDIEKVTNIRFCVETIEDMIYKTESFDVIMAHSVLHLVRDYKESLSKIHALLKPNGFLVLSIPCVGEVKWFKYLWPIGYKLGLIPYISFFKKDEFISHVKNQDFSIKTEWHTAKHSMFLILQK